MPSPLPHRVSWDDFPDVVLHAPIPVVKGHPDYEAGKSGDLTAAVRLVDAVISTNAVERLRALAGPEAVLVPVHAFESTGVNMIPIALAEALARRLDLSVSSSVVQVNLVAHTGASGFARLARQAVFEGDVEAGRRYLLVDDFVGQGGTLANLRGHLQRAGGEVVGCTVLTGKLHSTKLALSASTLYELRRKHGSDLERWWRDRFGHAFDGLTESEARYLARTANADRVRDRVAAEQPA